jgi:cytochrome P450
LEAILKETLRLNSPVNSFTHRVATEDMVLDDYFIPKGVCLLALSFSSALCRLPSFSSHRSIFLLLPPSPSITQPKFFQTYLAVNLIPVHNHKKYWGENANQFYPERWLGKGREKKKKNLRKKEGRQSNKSKA